MSNNKIKSEGLNIKSHRLSKKEIEDNFSDLHSPLTPIEALIEADRCYFCYDAPCTKACPSDIDVPGFIQSIRSCLLYTSPSPRDKHRSRMPSSA